MTNEELRAVIREGAIPKSLASKYLTIYVGSAEWNQHLTTLWGRIVKKERDKEKAAEIMRQALSCAVLLPFKDKSTQIDSQNPENLLFKCMSYRQFEERNWFELFQNVVEQDGKIEIWRTRALGLGVITPIEYAIHPRQAFNWLYTKAEETGAVTPENKEDVTARFRNLVLAYGGAVICNVFARHQDALRNVINWRTGYFFERVIFDVYNIEQVLKIKKAEIAKTSERLVKQIRVGENTNDS